jgi:hypothetical protein
MSLKSNAVHQKNGERWIAMPAKPYQDNDGVTRYNYIVKFVAKDRWYKFQQEPWPPWINIYLTTKRRRKSPTIFGSKDNR